MYTTAKFKVNESVPPVETDLLSLVWKRLQDGEITLTVQPAHQRDGKTIIPVSVDDKPAGWLRSRPIPGM